MLEFPGERDPGERRLSPAEIVRPVELEPLIAVARRLSAELQWRAACFGAGQFVDPAWDLILHLFIAEQGGGTIGVGDACARASLDRRAGRRWLGALAARGFLDVDGETLSLTARGRGTMTEFLTGLRAG